MFNKNFYNQIISLKIFQQIEQKNIPKEQLFQTLEYKIDTWEKFFNENIDWDLFTIISIVNELKLDFDKIIPTPSDLKIKDLNNILPLK